MAGGSAVGRMAVLVTGLFAFGACASGTTALQDRGLAQIRALGEEQGAVVQMRRAGCPGGGCPVYSVAVYMDGTLVYDGRENVAVLGERRAKLPPKRVDELVTAMGEAHFLDMPEECCLCPGTRRPRLVMIDYRPGFARKTILHDEACGAAPDAMNGLTDTIERVAGIRVWLYGEDAMAEAPPPIRSSAGLTEGEPIAPAPASDDLSYLP